MLMYLLTYIILGAGALIALAFMIVKIGGLLADCPDNGPATRAAAITIATGYVAIGAGGLILIGAVLPLLQDEALAAFFFALGLMAFCLGLGFTHAVGTLRAVIIDTKRKAPPNLNAAEA